MTLITPTDGRQYPIGLWDGRDTYTSDERHDFIDQLRHLPAQYRQRTESLTDENLTYQYRPGGWTVRQLVHHVADTYHWHLFRVKQALAEAEKTTGLFASVNAWATLPDTLMGPVEHSLLLIEGIHYRWAFLCDRLSEADWTRAYYHPGRQRDLSLAQALAVGVWHARHHLAHIELALHRTDAPGGIAVINAG